MNSLGTNMYLLKRYRPSDSLYLYFWECKDSKDPYTINAQKRSKDIGKKVHVTTLRSHENIFCAQIKLKCQRYSKGYVVYALIWMKTVYPRDTADTEQHMLFTDVILFKIVL